MVFNEFQVMQALVLLPITETKTLELSIVYSTFFVLFMDGHY